MSADHTASCITVAWMTAEAAFVAEGDVRSESSAAIDGRAHQMLTAGEITCVCEAIS